MAVREPFLTAVLTGDIVNSTQLSAEQEKDLVSEIKEVLDHHFVTPLYEFYRGDSFQIFMSDPADALRLALVCRALAIGIAGQAGEETMPVSDIRISIGIGRVPGGVNKLGLAKGEAFLLSGREFDQLKEKGQQLAISYSEPIANLGFQVMADYLDSVFKEMTVKQAGVIVLLLQGMNQQQLAARLNKSKSTISELSSAGRWPEIEKILKHYETLINLIL